MTHKNLILVLFIFPLIATAQEKKITLSEAKIATLTCSHKMTIKISEQDTTDDVFISFQNAKYSSIVDITGVYFNRDKNLRSFEDDIDSSINYIDDKEVEMEWSNKGYRLVKAKGFKNIFLYDYEESGYTVLNKSQVQKLLTWIKPVELRL